MYVRPFEATDFASAQDLLASRIRRDGRHAPAPFREVDSVAELESAISALWNQPFVSGSIALEGGEPVAYLLGVPRFDELMGRSVWIGSAGLGAAYDFDPDQFKELYALASEEWLRLGCFRHYVAVPSLEPRLLDTWYDLGFARQQAYGLRTLSEDDLHFEPTPGVDIRRAVAEDGEALAELSYVTARALAAPPAYAPHPPEYLIDRPRDYAQTAEDDEARVWVAQDGEKLVGVQIYYLSEPGAADFHVPAACAELAVGATLDSEQQRGITRSIGNQAVAELYREGIRYILTDWRTATLSASRAWPRLGYRLLFYRLYRHIDKRITWARP